MKTATAILVILATTAVFAQPTLEFLQHYIDVSDDWHVASLLLRISAFGVSFLSVAVAAMEKWKPSWKGAIIWISLLVAALNFGSIVFFSDFRTYEKAHIMYDTEIRSFQATYEDQIWRMNNSQKSIEPRRLD